MAGPNKILEILNDMYKVIKGKYPFIFYHEDIIKSALVYKALYYIEFGKLINVADVLKEFNGDINLTDPGYSCLTLTLERLFGKIKYIHLNKAFHYAYGRFYKKYKKGRGYCLLCFTRKHDNTLSEKFSSLRLYIRSFLEYYPQ